MHLLYWEKLPLKFSYKPSQSGSENVVSGYVLINKVSHQIHKTNKKRMLANDYSKNNVPLLCCRYVESVLMWDSKHLELFGNFWRNSITANKDIKQKKIIIVMMYEVRPILTLTMSYRDSWKATRSVLVQQN